MEEINLKEIYDYFKSKVIWILITVIVALILGNIYSFLIKTPMYQSNTTIVLVNEKKKDTYNQSDIQLNKNLVGTYSEIIKSRKVLAKVLENLELSYNIETLSNMITVNSVEDTEIIQIGVKNSSNEEASRITDEIAKVFSEEIKTIYNLENVSIIDKAEIEEKPYNINHLRDNILFFFIGVFLSCGVIFLFYYFDTTIKSDEIVEQKLGLTVLGIVPKENKE